MRQRANAQATQICNALFRVGNYKLEDAIANLDRLKMQLLKSRNRFNETLERKIEEQEAYIDRLLSCNKFKKRR